uniref:Maternal effect embryo arrest 50 protein n=1 Tax=Dimocarpus longan TaxID=128017 RepID=M1T555_9ROSI|nr:maternal effect embryo arrest 50 protein [Dimocarpus longan]
MTALRPDPDFEVIRIGLQVLANVSVAGQKHQQAIWSRCFPDLFVSLAGLQSRQTCDPLCMLVYTCCDGSPELYQVICDILVQIICTVCSVGFGEDWFKLLVSRLCLEDVYFPVLFSKLKDASVGDDGFSSEQGFLLRVVSDIVNERIEEIRAPRDFALCVLGIFRKSVGLVDFFSRVKSGLPTDCVSVNVLGYSVSILRDVCAREDPSGCDSEDDVVGRLLSSGLIELFLSLLCDLEPPAIIRKAMRVSEKEEGTSSYSAKTCPYMGFRKDIVAVIGNCAYRRKHVQDEIRERNGILLLLQQCVADEENPFLREWGIWSVRNLLEGNAENQQVVADLEVQGSVDVPELAGLGLKVEVDQQTRRAKLVNVGAKAS